MRAWCELGDILIGVSQEEVRSMHRLPLEGKIEVTIPGIAIVERDIELSFGIRKDSDLLFLDAETFPQGNEYDDIQEYRIYLSHEGYRRLEYVKSVAEFVDLPGIRKIAIYETNCIPHNTQIIQLASLKACKAKRAYK